MQSIESLEQKAINSAIMSWLKGSPVCLHGPTYTYLSLANICNYSCLMCGHESLMRKERGFMKMETLERYLDMLPDSIDRIWLFKQGESLLHPDFVKILETIKRKRPEIRMMLSSNGALMTEEISRSMIEHVEYFNVGIHSIDKDIYNRISGGKGSFDRVMNNLRTLEQLLEKHSGELKTYTITYVRQSANRHESPEAIADFFRHSLPKAERVVISWESNFGGEIKEANIDATSSLPYSQFPKCTLPYVNVNLCHDGKVTYCASDSRENWFIGDIYNDSFDDLWNGEKMQMLRAGLANGDYENLSKQDCQCKSCAWPWSPQTLKLQLFVARDYKALLKERIIEPFLIEHFIINGFIDFLNANLDKSLYNFSCAAKIDSDKEVLIDKAHTWMKNINDFIKRRYENIEHIEKELNKEGTSIRDKISTEYLLANVGS